MYVYIIQGKLKLGADRFSQCILCELTNQNKVGYIIVIYHSPSQSVIEFDDFLVNFEKLLNHARQLKLSFLVILGNFMLNPSHGGVRIQRLKKVIKLNH